MRKVWNDVWQKSGSVVGKHYFSLQPTIPPTPWFFRFRNFSKLITSVIIRLRLGHVCSPVFLAKLRIRDRSICECGLEDGTVDHLFLNCPNVSVALYDLLPISIPRPVNIKFLLSQIFSPDICRTLAKFIKINNIILFIYLFATLHLLI